MANYTVPPQAPAGQPYYPMDMRHMFPHYICSADNPRAVNGDVGKLSTSQEYVSEWLGAEWPCNMNAAQIVR